MCACSALISLSNYISMQISCGRSLFSMSFNVDNYLCIIQHLTGNKSDFGINARFAKIETDNNN